MLNILLTKVDFLNVRAIFYQGLTIFILSLFHFTTFAKLKKLFILAFEGCYVVFRKYSLIGIITLNLIPCFSHLVPNAVWEENYIL